MYCTELYCTVHYVLLLILAVMYSLTAILNLWRVRPITWTEQFIMSYGGLRGAFAFSLATTLPPDAFKNILVTTTLFIIIITTVLQVHILYFHISNILSLSVYQLTHST